MLPLLSAQSCVPYSLSAFPDLSRLQCSQRLTPCHLVTPSNNDTSVVTVERQLSNILSQANAGVGQSELSQECLDGFLALYCLRTYTICQQKGERREERVCEEDCLRVVRGVCGDGGWAYLSEIIDQLRRNGLIQLEALTDLDYCNISTSSRGAQAQVRCLALQSEWMTANLEGEVVV